MVVLTEKKTPSLIQGRAAGDLNLRIVGTERDGQIVRLKSPKCTIGSANGCTLRLRCNAVQPVQCVILRGSRGTVVRSWSARTRLNGQRFSESPLLAAGDRLKIGPIELEVLSSSSVEIEPRSFADSVDSKPDDAAWQQHQSTKESQ